MATFARSDDLQGAEFVGADLRGARFVGVRPVRCRDARGRHRGADIDAPWLSERRERPARQRRRRGPVRRGRAQPPLPRSRRAAGRGPGRSARGLGRARAHLGGHARARRGDAGRHGRRLGRTASGRSRRRCGTWCWPRTCGWAGRSWSSSSRSTRSGCRTPARGRRPDMSVFTTATPSYAEVLEVRAGRVAMVRDFLAAVTPEELAAERRNPHDPELPGDRPLLPARDPRGGVGAPPLRRPRPRPDRGVPRGGVSGPIRADLASSAGRRSGSAVRRSTDGSTRRAQCRHHDGVAQGVVARARSPARGARGPSRPSRRRP